MGKRPTIKDVARHAGVSKSTVSLVLQNSPLVKSETRTIVQASMKTLNYVRNKAAATLRGAGTGLIGLVINDLRNPFFTEFAASAQMALSERGYATVIANTDEDPAIQHQVITSMLEHGVSGLLISPCYGKTRPTFDAIARAQIPTMQVLRKADERARKFPLFSMDNDTGSHLAVEHLLSQGITEIAFVGGLESRQVTSERMVGYNRLMAENGLEQKVFFGRPTREFGRRIAFEIHEQRSSLRAAVCFNDLVALGMSSAFTQAGVKVGSEFYIVGYDDIEEVAQVFPQLSTVHCDVKAFGKRTASMLLNWLENGDLPAADTRFPVHLVVRQSSRVC
jgi:LacI family transcriptional regulator